MHDALLALVAARRGHFQMESGYHSEQWFELDRLFRDPEKLRPFVAALARRLAPHRPEIICGPQTGGAQLADLLAAELKIPAVHSERFEPPNPTGLFPVKYNVPAAQRALVRGKRLALVDDAISAGSAIRATHADLLDCGAHPIALGALFVFGDKAAAYAHEHHLSLECLAPMAFNIWPPDACPLCSGNIPVARVSDAV
ncbi:MAG: phosphoribosyltransferase family protein [Verrucomicrobiota bacterium]